MKKIISVLILSSSSLMCSENYDSGVGVGQLETNEEMVSKSIVQLVQDSSSEAQRIKKRLESLSDDFKNYEATKLIQQIKVSKKSYLKNLLLAVLAILGYKVYSIYFQNSVVRYTLSGNNIDWLSLTKNGVYISLGLTAIYFITLLWKKIKSFFFDDNIQELHNVQRYNEKIYNELQDIKKNFIKLYENNQTLGSLVQGATDKIGIILPLVVKIESEESHNLEFMLELSQRLNLLESCNENKLRCGIQKAAKKLDNEIKMLEKQSGENAQNELESKKMVRKRLLDHPSMKAASSK